MKTKGSFGGLFIAIEEATIDNWIEEVRCMFWNVDWLIELTRPCGCLADLFACVTFKLKIISSLGSCIGMRMVKQLILGLVWLWRLKARTWWFHKYWRHKERGCCPKLLLPYIPSSLWSINVLKTSLCQSLFIGLVSVVWYQSSNILHFVENN